MTNADWLKERVNYANDDCLIWPFFRDPRKGYGKMGYLGKIWWAHRLMCTFAHGPAPTPKHQTAHSCGNGHLGCVNPLHLSWKNNRENSLDRSGHGRWKYQPRRLSKEIVARLKLRQGSKTIEATATEFGISNSLVQYHWYGHKTWR